MELKAFLQFRVTSTRRAEGSLCVSMRVWGAPKKLLSPDRGAHSELKKSSSKANLFSMQTAFVTQRRSTSPTAMGRSPPLSLHQGEETCSGDDLGAAFRHVSLPREHPLDKRGQRDALVIRLASPSPIQR